MSKSISGRRLLVESDISRPQSLATSSWLATRKSPRTRDKRMGVLELTEVTDNLSMNCKQQGTKGGGEEEEEEEEEIR